MRARWIICLCFSIVTSTALFGQSLTTKADSVVSQKNKWQYFFTIQSGAIVNAGDPVTFSTSSIHGARLGRLRVGVGTGLDAYKEWQVVPVYGSVSWDVINRREKAVFARLNYGLAKAWKLRSDDEYGFAKARGGETFSAMLGYRFPVGKVSLAVQTGYKFQRVEARYEYYYSIYSYSSFYLPYPKSSEPSSTETVVRNMGRLAIEFSVIWR